MRYRAVPGTNDRLSILGYGCMRFPTRQGAIDEDRATAMLHAAIDGGVNYLDTAVPYHRGTSEAFLGRALKNGYRGRVRVATKLAHWLVWSESDMHRMLDAQLERLQTDRIDYYLIHNLNDASWQRAVELGVKPFLDAALKDGRIRNAGFSFHGAPDAFGRIVDDYDWTFCQIQYNLLDRRNQAGEAGLKYAASRGLGVIVMEPLRGGNLAGAAPAEVAAVWDRAPRRRTPAEWALRWVWNHPEVTCALSGMGEEAHLEENLRVADQGEPGSLTPEELGLVDEATAAYKRLMKIGCTGCRYCLPCPAGVDIPSCFELYNLFHTFGSPRSARLFYLLRVGGVGGLGKSGYAGLCRRCGQCESKCPQGLPIQRHLREVSKQFDTLGLRVIRWVARPYSAFMRWKGRLGGKRAD